MVRLHNLHFIIIKIESMHNSLNYLINNLDQMVLPVRMYLTVNGF